MRNKFLAAMIISALTAFGVNATTISNSSTTAGQTKQQTKKRGVIKKTTHATKKGAIEVGDKVEDGWDYTKKGANEVGDKTEDGWDQTKKGTKKAAHYTKKGAIEAGDKVEDGWDQTKKGTNEAGDKIEDGYDQTKKGVKKLFGKDEKKYDHDKHGNIKKD